MIFVSNSINYLFPLPEHFFIQSLWFPASRKKIHLHFKRRRFPRIKKKKSHHSSDKSRRDWNRHELTQDFVPDLNPIGALIYCIKICLQDYWVSLYWFFCHSSPHVATKNTIWHQSEKVVQPAGLINGERGFLRLFTAAFVSLRGPAAK